MFEEKFGSVDLIERARMKTAMNDKEFDEEVL